MFKNSVLSDWTLFILFSAAVLTMPIWLAPLGAGYPDLMQKFAIFGIFAISALSVCAVQESTSRS